MLKHAILNDRRIKPTPISSVSSSAPKPSKPLIAEQTHHFKQQIAHGKVKKVLEELLRIFLNQNPAAYDELLQHFQLNERNQRLGIVEKSTYNTERNQITHVLLAFLNG